MDVDLNKMSKRIGSLGKRKEVGVIRPYKSKWVMGADEESGEGHIFMVPKSLAPF